MPEVIRTVTQEIVNDSSTSPSDGELINITGIGGHITGVTIRPVSGSPEVQGIDGDDWVPIPDAGIGFDFDLKFYDTSKIPRVRSSSGDAEISLFFTVEVKN